MRSSVLMEAYPQTPPVGHRLHAPQQTSCSSLPSSTPQAQYNTAQQRMSNQHNNQQSHGLWNSQSCSQPVTSSSDLQSRHVPQTWFTNSQNLTHLRNSAPMRATLPNGQFAPLPAAQHGTPTQNLNHHPQSLNRNTGPQQNYMSSLHNVSTVSWFSTPYSNGGSAIEQSHRTHQSALPQYQSLNGHHTRMQTAHQPVAQPQQTNWPVQIQSNQAQQKMYNNQGQIRGGKGNGALHSTVNYYPVTSQRLITPSQPSNYDHQVGHIHSGNNGTWGQHSSQIQHQTSPYTMENNSAGHSYLKHSGNKQTSNLPQHLPYVSKHIFTQSQPNQKANPSSALSLPQDVAQPQIPLQQGCTIPVSGHHNKTCHTIAPVIQGNTQPQVLQLSNTPTGLPMSYPVTVSSSTPISEAPPPNYTESTLNYSHTTLMKLLLENNKTQVPVQKHASFTTHGQTPTHTTAKTSYSQTPESVPYYNPPAALCSKEVKIVSKYQTPVIVKKKNENAFGNQLKAPDVQSFEGMQSRRLQTNPNTERRDGHGEVQYSERVAESLELLMALHKVIKQSHKAVAVVPPISQQVTSPETNDHVTTSPDDSLPIKINAVWTLVKDGTNMEQESNTPSLSKETTEELLNLFSVQHPETQEQNKLDDASPVDSQPPETQSTDIPQSKTGSNTSQDPVCSTVLTSQSPEDHNNDDTGQSKSNVFDLSKVQVLNFTLEKLIFWVSLLECTPVARLKEPVADLEKCLLDLFWDGNKKNLAKQVHGFTAAISDFSTISIKETQTAVFQYLQPKDLIMLEQGYHILKNDALMPTEEFRSSWLNVDGQPSDIDKVLAEPILDLNPTDYALCGEVNIYSESEPSTKVIPATTDGENDKPINKELANLQVCESKCTDTASSAQEESKTQDDENLEKHQQQDVNMNLEEPVDSNEKADSWTDDKRNTECEQIGRDASEDIASSSEIVEQIDLSNDDNSSNDSQLIELSLLSFDDARMLFKQYSGCDLEKEPSQLCQDETKFSATPDNESKDFCSSINQIKFTCPHVIDIDGEGEHFCPKCWEETPLLDLDLDEPLFSPKMSSPNMRTPPTQGCPNQSCSLQSGEPDSNCTILSVRSSMADSPAPNDDVLEVTVSGPNPSEAAERSSSLTSKSAVKEPHAPACTESVRFTVTVEKEVCATNRLIGPELANAPSSTQNTENLFIPQQTKTPRDEVCPPESPPHKKIKVTKTISIPSEDDHFTADITKIASSTKPCPSDHTVTLAEAGESVQSCSSPSGKSLDEEAHGRACSESVRVTVPVELVHEADLPKALPLSQNIEKRKLFNQSQTKTSGEKDFPPIYPVCKKTRVTKTISVPAEVDLFTPDIVVKKASATKPYPSDHSVTLAKDVQNCKYEREERKSIPVKLNIDAQLPQSGKPDPNMNVCLESKSNSSDSSTFGVNMTITESDPNLGDSVQSCSSASGKSLENKARGRTGSESVKVTVPVELVCEAKLPKAPVLSQNIEKRKLFIQSQTKTSGEKDSPPRYPPCKKIKVTKTISIPAKDALFTPDIVVKKASCTKPHPSDLNVTRGQHGKDERREKGEGRNSVIVLKSKCDQHSCQTKIGAQGKWIKTCFMCEVPNGIPQPKRPATISDTKKEKVYGKTKTDQNKSMKKLALYGFTNSNQNRIVQHKCHDRTKSSEAPVYITITNTPESAKYYTDAPSAKQKVYSDWSSAHVETKKSTSSHKKHQKPVKVVLKSIIQEQKSLLKERFALKMKSFADGAK